LRWSREDKKTGLFVGRREDKKTDLFVGRESGRGMGGRGIRWVGCGRWWGEDKKTGLFVGE